MRVLHVNDNPPGHGHGGTEVFLSRLLEAQIAQGDVVSVLTGDGSHQGRRGALDLWDTRSLQRLQLRVALFRPDVVHLHNVVRELSPAVLKPTGVPTVMTFHDLRLLGGSEHALPDLRAVAARGWIEPVFHRLAQGLAATVGVSDVVTSHLDGLPSPSTVLVPVPRPEVLPTSVAACDDVLFAGRLSRDKGAEVLVSAFRQISARHPHARLVLAGDGPERVRLRVLAGADALVGQLTAREVSAALGRARVVVVPSLPALRPEGSSLIAVEAARHARPVLTSDDPAVAEAARRIGGDIVPAGDVDALAARLDHWLTRPSAAVAAGKRAAEAAVVHDPSAVAAAYTAVYAKACGL